VGRKSYKVNPAQLKLVAAQASVDSGSPFHLRLNWHLRQYPASFKRLATILGVQDETLARWMSGTTSPDALEVIRICKITGITPNDLFGLAETEIIPNITRRELEYLDILTLNAQLKAVDIEAIANKISQDNNGVLSKYELWLRGVAGMAQELVKLQGVK